MNAEHMAELTAAFYLACIACGLFLVGYVKQTRRAKRAEDRLEIAEIVCDTLAYDLADALRIGRPALVSDTPLHDEVVVELFRKQLDGEVPM